MSPLGALDLIEPVVGFRQWSVHGDRLHSPFCGDVWEDLELHASCPLGTHDPCEVPATNCSCGVYAYYEQPPRSSAATRDLVIGVIAVWGQLELHSGGMRASHARIVGLALPLSRGRKRQMLVKAANWLEVPAVPHRRLRRIAAHAGAAVPVALRPPRTRLPLNGPSGLARSGGLPRAPVQRPS